VKLSESPSLQWVAAGALSTAWGFSLSLQESLEGRALSLLGIATLLSMLYIYHRSGTSIKEYWDSYRSSLAIIRRWHVEVCSLRLIQSVPLGIDLSHSASKVLTAMKIRYLEESDGTVEFVLCRPLGSTKTRIGFMVSRMGYRLPNGVRRMELLADKVAEDANILESAMRAAYPHTPVTIAGADDIELIRRGGVELLETAA
jgi:hypothetical protein